MTFVSEHPVGTTVEGTVSTFVSHGAMVDVGGSMVCYVPLAGLGVPPPRGAREVLERGDRRQFVLVALDPARRGAELALPDVYATRQPG
ncbi:MAG: S1 RNA-binding domain-containing protein [Acidimicrobiales bacterium]